MNREDILRLAREARIEQDGEMLYSFRNSDKDQDVRIEDLERFATLVAAAERERIIAANAPEIEKINAHIKTLEDAISAEREACAKVCESAIASIWEFSPEDVKQTGTNVCNNLAAAIRARGQS